MALFGKKKKPEPTAPPAQTQDETEVLSGDADELDEQDNGGQSIDFDAIADELGTDDGATTFGASTAATPFDNDTLGASTLANSTGAFASAADFDDGDELDFDDVFDDETPATAMPATGENPFGANLNDEATFSDASASGPIAIEPVSDAPPLTYTAPLLTADAVATAGVPRARKSFPLPLLLGVVGLLIALGAVGYLVTRSTPESQDAPVVAANPPLRAPRPGGASLVNLGASVDGVPIAPGAVGGAPALAGPKPTVPLTPALLKKLKDLWQQGAVAKKKGDFAGARAAWTKMLQLRPNHPLVQSAIDKLPAA